MGKLPCVHEMDAGSHRVGDEFELREGSRVTDNQQARQTASTITRRSPFHAKGFG